ncbi:hypothetical protein [Halobacteriovorax sp.]|uniref:hypothetical protein n=1 Tax=Halobacteriovorax sp. TaxID=2020862 RepID=UPI003AF2C7BD
MKRLTKAKETKSLNKEGENSSLKKVKVSVLALTLIHSSLPLSAQAFVKKDGETWSQYTSGSGAKTIMGALNLVGNMSKQMYNQGQLSQQEIQGLHSFNKAQADAQQKMSARRFHPAFNCPLAPEPILAPNGACSVGGQMKIPEQALEFGQKILNEYMSFKKPRNVPPYIGEQCLTEGLKSIEDNYQSMTSKYEEMIAQFEAQLNQTIEIQKKNKIKVDELNALLNGGGNKVSQDFKNTDFNKLLPENCVDAYDVNKIIKSPRGGGLVGLKDKMTNDEREAKGFRGHSLAELNAKIASDKKKVIAALKKDGLGALTRNSTYSGLRFGKLFNDIGKGNLRADLGTRAAKINNLMSKLGVSDADVPKDPLDPSFSAKVERLAAKSTASYQEKFVLECMSGSNRAAYSTPLAQSLKSFDHVKLGNSGDALSRFKRVASDAFSSPTSLSALDRTVNSIEDGNIRITVTNSSGRDVTKSVGQYYNDLKNECTAIYNGDLKPAGDAAKLETYRAEVQELVSEAKKLQEDTSRSIASGGEGSISALIDEALYNCNGRSVELSSCSSKDTYNTSSSSFCVTQAASCSENLAQCSAFTENLVQQKTQELKQQADLYNAQMMQQEERAKALVTQMQSHMSNVADKMYKGMFPNLTPAAAKAFGLSSMNGLTFEGGLTAIDVPKSDQQIAGIFLEKDPEKFKKALMDQMVGNISKMKGSLENWKKEQMNHIAEQKSTIGQSLNDEITKWQNFVSDCNGAIQERNNKMASQLEEARKQAADNSKKQMEFCQKMRGLQEQGYGPGCSGDHSAKDLYSDAVEIASVLQAQQPQRGPASILNPGGNSTLIFEQINEYNRFCDEAGREGLLSEDGESANPTDDLKKACARANGTRNLAKKLKDIVFDNMTDEEKNSEDDLKSYISEALAKIEAGETYDNMNDALHEKLNSSTVTSVQTYLGFEQSNYNLKNNNKLGEDICRAIKKSKTAYSKAQCEGESDESDGGKSAYERCIDREDDNYKDGLAEALGVDDVSITLKRTMNPGLQDAWKSIGEKYSGTACAAINGSQLGQKGLIPGLMEKINRDIASEDGMIQ